MGKLLDFCAMHLGSILNWLYENIAVHNYGLAIIMFTLIIKLALLPLTIKQQKSMVEMKKIQPKLDELKKKYKDDPQRFNMEMGKMYQENGVNPGVGCFTSLIQFPILLSVFYVVSKPLTYMKHMSAHQIAELAKTIAGKGVNMYNEIAIVAHNNILNMNFLGLDLSKVPTIRIFSGGNTMEYLSLLILPILVVVTTFLSAKITTMNVDDNEKSKSMGKSMIYISILGTAFFSFRVPAGLSVYWIVNNLCSIMQQIYINKYVTTED